ncbi:MAG: type III secretion inner membrane ring lipoprotein SctJ [Chlamydiae bacterium]|nr:type III secretion inner membrane ring lipoprotein SctJ [Chlamydiota bacterium]
MLKKIILSIAALLFLASCETNRFIVNNVDERDANEIIVFLASKGIKSDKIQAEGEAAAGGGPTNLWNITVEESKAVDAMSILNQNGLPRRAGTNLLTLFAKQGLMTSDKEETIRYQAGVEEELKNTILKIDGILDADVKISFPSATAAALLPGTAAPKIKAAVYVKHQGILDDPNQHLESKIKRLVAGSIEGISYEDVSVISDKARFADISLRMDSSMVGAKEKGKDQVSIWSIVMNKQSASRFRTIFSLMIFLILGFGALIGWLIYKFYPYIQKERAALIKKSQQK